MPFIGNQPTAVPLTSADITDGTITLADLSATGTKDATTFLRGDNTFAEAGGGKLLQIVQATDTVGGNTNSTSFVATNTSVTITPSSTSSKILVFATGTTELTNGRGYLTIFRNTTNLVADALVINQVVSLQNPFAMHYLDSPSTTSATTYKIYIRVQNGADTIYTGGGTLVMNAMEISA